MTSSERHLKPGQPRWDFNVQKYKSFDDVFCESDLFSIIVLAHGRPDTTRRSILSTLDCIRQYVGEVEWVFIENGGNKENFEFFDGLNVERKIIIRQKNYGINEGLNNGWGVSRGEFVMIHENDWEAVRQVEFLSLALDIFKERSDVGIIQLRDPFDPHENHGKYKPLYCPWSCNVEQLAKENVKVWKETTIAGHNYLLSEYPNGFNNNPILIRKQVYRECGPYPEAQVGFDARHGESLYQARVAQLGCCIAYIGIPIYWHIGRVQTQAI